MLVFTIIVSILLTSEKFASSMPIDNAWGIVFTQALSIGMKKT